MSGLEGLLAGRTLAGRYRIEEVIGRGGFAAVYRASDERLGRTVAVKVITVVAADLATRDQVRRRFEREARVAASLDHPNVVTVYDVGTDPDLELDFLVMELLRGEDLSRRLARPVPFALPMAARILRDAARGIAAGHRGGLIHRDVKPANIFLAEHEREERFRVCILDFGIAQIRSAEHSLTKLTRGAAPLSPRYASPEQLQEEVELTPASDVFSLGLIGYELVTGERPFGRDQIRSMTRGEPASQPSFDAVPEELRDIIRRAMEQDPAERYPEAGELADALDAALRTMRPDTAPAVAVPPAAVLPDDHATVIETPEPEVLPASAPPAASPPAPDAAPSPEPLPVASVDPVPDPVSAQPVAPATPSVPLAAVPEDAPAPPVAPSPAAAPAHSERTRIVATPAATVPPAPKRARRTSPLLLLAIPLLLALGAVAWWAMARDRPAEPRRAQVEAPRPAEVAPPAAPTPRAPDSLGWSAADSGAVSPGTTPGAAPGADPGSGAPAAGTVAAGGGGVAPAGGAPRAGTPTVTPAGTQPPRAAAPAGGAGAARYAREAEGHFERGDFPAAVAGFRRAVAAAPGNALYRNQLGWALFQSGDLAGAERELQETLRLDPNRAIAHANLGEVRRVRGDTGRAIQSYRRFLQLNTDPRRERIAQEKLRGMGATP
ncbi:MAG TPA: protein kinase [Longimicrobium sp.]